MRCHRGLRTVGPAARADARAAGLPRGAVEIGGDGEVLWKGGNVMRGWEASGRPSTAADPTSGKLHTGDLGEIDGDATCGSRAARKI